MPTSLPAAFLGTAPAKTSPNRAWRSITMSQKMRALVDNLSRIFRNASDIDTTWIVLIAFCLAGLVLSPFCVSNGTDLFSQFVGP